MKRLLVLRPEPGAGATAAKARELGLEADCVPLFIGVLNLYGEDLLEDVDDALVARVLPLLGEIGAVAVRALQRVTKLVMPTTIQLMPDSFGDKTAAASFKAVNVADQVRRKRYRHVFDIIHFNFPLQSRAITPSRNIHGFYFPINCTATPIRTMPAMVANETEKLGERRCASGNRSLVAV